MSTLDLYPGFTKIGDHYKAKIRVCEGTEIRRTHVVGPQFDTHGMAMSRAVMVCLKWQALYPRAYKLVMQWDG